MKKYKYGKKRDELQALVKSDTGYEIMPEIDVRTRWNSILPMFRKFLQLKKYIQMHVISSNEEFKFDEACFEKIKEIICVLTPIETTIKEISKSDANLMVADIAMTNCLSSIGTSEIAEKMRTALIRRFEKRRGIFSDVLWHLRGMESI